MKEFQVTFKRYIIGQICFVYERAIIDVFITGKYAVSEVRHHAHKRYEVMGGVRVVL